MINYMAVRTIPKTISPYSCPADLMGEISKKANGTFAFRLTRKAFATMLAFPASKTITYEEVEAYSGKYLFVMITWIPSGETMNLVSTDGGTTFWVCFANTEEIEYEMISDDCGDLFEIDVEEIV